MSESASVRCAPLTGIKVVEMAAIGPVPFAGMVLGDMGAAVVRIDRPEASGLGLEVSPRFDCMARGKRSIALDLKKEQGVGLAKELIGGADIVIEGFRPGVMERLGLSPQTCIDLNPRLVFGRCSGWGAAGPLADTASHDLNLVAMSGALAAMGVAGAPSPPLNLIGDFGGAGMHLVAGVLAAALSARVTGKGQVVETSIFQGATALMPMLYGLHAEGRWSLARGENDLDGGAPYYRCYETKDGRWLAVAPIEPKFYRAFLERAGLEGRLDPTQQKDRAAWPATVEVIAARLKELSRDDWMARFSGSDACVTPVLDMSEAPSHPQHQAGGTFLAVDGVIQPGAGVRFSQAPPVLPVAPAAPGRDTAQVLTDMGYPSDKIEEFVRAGIVARGPV